MPGTIVERLELVHVEHGDGEIHSPFRLLGIDAFEILVQVASVAQTGEGVEVGFAFGLLEETAHLPGLTGDGFVHGALQALSLLATAGDLLAQRVDAAGDGADFIGAFEGQRRLPGARAVRRLTAEFRQGAAYPAVEQAQRHGAHQNHDHQDERDAGRSRHAHPAGRTGEFSGHHHIGERQKVRAAADGGKGFRQTGRGGGVRPTNDNRVAVGGKVDRIGRRRIPRPGAHHLALGVGDRNGGQVAGPHQRDAELFESFNQAVVAGAEAFDKVGGHA